MDSDRFDRLTRHISTRRGMIGRVLAGGLASLLGMSAVGEAAQKSCARQTTLWQEMHPALKDVLHWGEEGVRQEVHSESVALLPDQQEALR